MGLLAAAGKLLPVALAFSGGVLFARRKIIQASDARVFNDFCFLFAIPSYLFAKIYTADLRHLFDWHALGSYMISVITGMALLAVAVHLVSRPGPRGLALRLMAGVQVNTAYFAIPVFIMLWGDATPIFPVLLMQTCLLTATVIAIMEFDTGSEGSVPAKVSKAVWSSLNTPVVIACWAGIALNLVDIPVPQAALDAFGFVGQAAAPIALFALGLYLGGAGISLRGTTREEIALVTIKCLVMPVAIYLLCRYAFDVRPPWLHYLTVLAAMPAAQNLFIVAQRYEVETELAASLVVKSSAASLALLPLWIYLVA
ncbi:AEC family transporter [Pseudonocardiaceae bacterium YIM PH 21723]|nr:AEC family transporter [Pseudonocardiaceae bacterium YIM PH 21723]